MVLRMLGWRKRVLEEFACFLPSSQVAATASVAETAAVAYAPAPRPPILLDKLAPMVYICKPCRS